MVLKGEVVKLEHCDDEVMVTVSNLKSSTAAEWRECSPNFSFRAPFASAKSFSIGRRVTLTVEAQ